MEPPRSQLCHQSSGDSAFSCCAALAAHHSSTDVDTFSPSTYFTVLATTTMTTPQTEKWLVTHAVIN